MSQFNNAMNDLVTDIRTFLDVIQKIREHTDRFASNNALYTSQTIRPDITSTELADAMGALGQVTFTLDSGSPSQKAKLYELL